MQVRWPPNIGLFRLHSHYMFVSVHLRSLQGEHSRELEKLKRENRELRQQLLARKQLLGRDAVVSGGKRRQMKACLIQFACAH